MKHTRQEYPNFIHLGFSFNSVLHTLCQNTTLWNSGQQCTIILINSSWLSTFSDCQHVLEFHGFRWCPSFWFHHKQQSYYPIFFTLHFAPVSSRLMLWLLLLETRCTESGAAWDYISLFFLICTVWWFWRQSTQCLLNNNLNCHCLCQMITPYFTSAETIEYICMFGFYPKRLRLDKWALHFCHCMYSLRIYIILLL